MNLRVEMAVLGLAPRVLLLPSPSQPHHLATVLIGTDTPLDEGSEEVTLAAAIGRRFTPRSAFMDVAVAGALLDAFAAATVPEGVECRIVEQPELSALAAWTRAGHRRQETDIDLRREVLGWIRPTSETVDGIVPTAVGLDSTVNRESRFPQRDFAVNRDVAWDSGPATDLRVTTVVLTTEGDEPVDWIHTGMALERLLLIAAGEGVMASYLNQSVEVTPLRARLRASLGLKGVPQLVIRMGYPPVGASPMSPRRKLADVLLDPL